MVEITKVEVNYNGKHVSAWATWNGEFISAMSEPGDDALTLMAYLAERVSEITDAWQRDEDAAAASDRWQGF